MDWTKLRLSSLNNVDLPIVDAAPSDPFILRTVDGLGAADRTVSISKPTYEGSVLQSIQPQNRIVVAQIGLQPNWNTGQSSSDLREFFYEMLSGGYENAPVDLSVMNGSTVICGVAGHVEKLEPAMFSKDPSVQLTLPCLSPYLSAPAAVHPSTSGLSKYVPEITNVGTAPTGFDLTITFTASMSSWQMEKQDGAMKMNFVYPFLSGDILRIVTEPGNKQIRLTRSGVTTSLLKALTADSGWLKLYRGVNGFNISNPAFNWTDLAYTPRYQGI